MPWQPVSERRSLKLLAACPETSPRARKHEGAPSARPLKSLLLETLPCDGDPHVQRRPAWHSEVWEEGRGSRQPLQHR